MTRFVILAAPRTGSNWLCSLLDSHPEILCHHEIFNPEGIHMALSRRGGDSNFGTVADRDRDPLGVLDRVWRETFGHRAIGFKFNRAQNALVLRHVLEDRDVRKIFIRRTNRIRAFVSERIAEITGEWESYPDSRANGKKIAVTVDPAELRRHVRLNQHYYRGLSRRLENLGQTALDIRYEDLERAETRSRMLTYLGVSPRVDLSTRTRKQHADGLHQLITNFDDLRARLRGSVLEVDMEDREFQLKDGMGAQ